MRRVGHRERWQIRHSCVREGRAERALSLLSTVDERLERCCGKDTRSVVEMASSRRDQNDENGQNIPRTQLMGGTHARGTLDHKQTWIHLFSAAHVICHGLHISWLRGRELIILFCFAGPT